jgi:type III secretory pathway lipoprotein EscJ
LKTFETCEPSFSPSFLAAVFVGPHQRIRSYLSLKTIVVNSQRTLRWKNVSVVFDPAWNQTYLKGSDTDYRMKEISLEI